MRSAPADSRNHPTRPKPPVASSLFQPFDSLFEQDLLGGNVSDEFVLTPKHADDGRSQYEHQAD